MAKLNDARRSLQRAKESAQERLKQLDDERREIKASLKSLDAALKALGVATPSNHSKHPPTTMSEVTKMLVEMLANNEAKTKDELETLVGDKLSQSGRSRVGLDVHIAEALKEDRFVDTADGYSLQN